MRALHKIVLSLGLLLMFALPAAAQTAPQALPDTFTVALTGTRDIFEIPFSSLLANDVTEAGVLSSISSVGLSAQGVTPVLNAASSSVQYPLSSLLGSSFNGAYRDTFAYVLSQNGASSTGYVSVTFLNAPPTASDVFAHTPPASSVRTSFAVLLGGGSFADSDCDDMDRSACSHVLTVDSPPECGSTSQTIDGVIFTALDGGGLSCPAGVYLIPYHVTDPWGAASNTAFFHVVHDLTVGEVISLNGSLDNVVKVGKQWLPANFKFSGSLITLGKVRAVANPLYADSSLEGNNPLYCGKTDHLRNTPVNQRTCTCGAGYYSGADCGLQVVNVKGGSFKMVQTLPLLSLSDSDTITFSFIVNSHAIPGTDIARLSAKLSVVGTDTVFTCAGEMQVAHEVAHVVQQTCVRSGSSLPVGLPIALKATVTYKSGGGSGKVSFQDFHFVIKGGVGFPRPGDVNSVVVVPARVLPLPVAP